MKIALLNFAFCNNYGAVLQSLALQTLLQKMGNEVELIDYRPTYLTQYDIPYPNPVSSAYWSFRANFDRNNVKRVYHTIGAFVRRIQGYREAPLRQSRQRAFLPFYEKHFSRTICYHSYRQLRDNPPQADCYLCGSDQLWNPVVTCILDPAYFLAFGKQDTPRIAYAISPSQLNVEENARTLKQYLSGFKAVSLREKQHQEALQKLYDGKIEVCIDPTLMIHIESFSDYEERIPQSEPYILTYGFTDQKGDHLLKAALQKASEYFGLNVIDISQDEIQWDKNVDRKRAVTPGQFLSYIKNAAYIVTNSFHGLCFSIQYQRPFCCAPKPGTGARMDELMNRLGLTERRFASETAPLPTQPIPYSGIHDKLSMDQENSLRFLKDALSLQQVKHP